MNREEEIRKYSDLSVSEISGICEELRLRCPSIYETLLNPDGVESEYYERTTIGLMTYLRENKDLTGEVDRFKLSKIQRDIINFLAGRL